MCLSDTNTKCLALSRLLASLRGRFSATADIELQVPDTQCSRTLVGSPESFYRINGAIRDLDEDITEFSAKPTAVILRQLCKIPVRISMFSGLRRVGR
eukprot:1652566-Rhodomonas_salina.7